MSRQERNGAASRRLLLVAAGLTVGGALLADRLGRPMTGGRVGTVATSAGEPGRTLDVLDCAGWGAREPSRPVTELNNPPVKIIVHHTATANRAQPLALDVVARAIQGYHMDVNGWIDSGHHFLVSRAGLVAEGRHRSLETLLTGQHLIEGTHCPDQNTTSIGIENEGTFTEADPPAGQLSTLRALLAVTCRQYGIRPTQLYGHRDFRDTACPGDRLYSLLPSLRSAVAGMLGEDARASSPATWPLLRIADQGPRVLAAQHLLRAAGMPGVPADGRFGRTTADGVRTFQGAHRLELTGMIGGGSWPLLAVPVRLGQGGEAEAAVRVLLGARPPGADWTPPETIRAPTWQRLLGTG